MCGFKALQSDYHACLSVRELTAGLMSDSFPSCAAKWLHSAIVPFMSSSVELSVSKSCFDSYAPHSRPANAMTDWTISRNLTSADS